MTLVPLRADHAPALLGLLAEPPLRAWLRADDEAQLRRRFAAWESRRSPDGRERWCNWAIIPTGDDLVVGWLQATVTPDHALIAYAVLPGHRGRGWAASAVRALDGRLGVGVLRAEIDSANRASEAVARAAGFTATTRRTGEGEVVWERPQRPQAGGP